MKGNICMGWFGGRKGMEEIVELYYDLKKKRKEKIKNKGSRASTDLVFPM